MSIISVRRRLLAAGAVAAVAALTLTACSGNPVSGDGSDDQSPAASDSEPEADPVRLAANVKDGASGVAVDKVVSVSADDGSLDSVSMFAGRDVPENHVDGDLAGGGSAWKAAPGALEPGKRYKVVMKGTNSEGEATTERTSFTTAQLSLDQQTYASISPLDGASVGVAMPIIVTFDIGVQDKAAIERQLEVESSPKVEGSWSWISDNEVHFRPKQYWPADSKITVNANVNSVKAGPNLYGQENNSATFKTGDAVTSVVNVAGHKMTVKVNGKTARTLPITTGMPGYETRAGTKVVMEKYDVKRMDAATTGVSKDDPEYYNIPDVQYAMRVTSSGEFIHAAPWSVGSQGTENVSHGCVGLSTADAEWLYSHSSIGDPVKFVNSPRTLEDYNGWTDWDQSYKQFKQGSAL